MRLTTPRPTATTAAKRRRAWRIRTVLLLVAGAVVGCVGIVAALRREPAAVVRPPTRPNFSTRQSISLEEARSAALQAGPLDLDGLVTLAPEAAMALAQHEGPISLRGLVDRLRSAEVLPAPVAALVARTDAPLHLDGLAEISLELAVSLGPHRHLLALPAVRSLPADVAEALAGHVGPVELAGLESLESASLARKLLAGGEANFSSIASVSPTVADILADAEQPLDLTRLVAAAADHDDLDDSTARLIARHAGAVRLLRLRTLSPDVARLLAETSGDLEFTGLGTLAPEAAEALAKHDGQLALPALRDAGESADALARHRGPLTLERLAHLNSASLAEKLLADGRRDFGSVEHLSVAAAERLAACPDPLRLDALQRPTDDVARILARHPGPLGLAGIVAESQLVTRLTPASADLIAKHSGPLALPRLRNLESTALAARLVGEVQDGLAAVETMPADVEELIARHDAPLSLGSLTAIHTASLATKLLGQGRTDFDRLQTVTVEAADTLANHEGPLSLATLVEVARQAPQLDVATARCLARHADEIRLDGLVTLSPGVAEMLAAHPGPLRLDRLGVLPAPVAEALARHTGLLSLQSVPHLDELAQEALARHPGPLVLGRVDGLSSGPLAAKLVAEGRTEFGSVLALSPPAAAALAAVKGTLFLNSLETLDAATAAALAAHSGGLSLDGVSSLDAPAAMAIAVHAGDLSLNGIRSLDPAAAEALSRHVGRVYLDGLASTANGLR